MVIKQRFFSGETLNRDPVYQCFIHGSGGSVEATSNFLGITRPLTREPLDALPSHRVLCVVLSLLCISEARQWNVTYMRGINHYCVSIISSATQTHWLLAKPYNRDDYIGIVLECCLSLTDNQTHTYEKHTIRHYVPIV